MSIPFSGANERVGIDGKWYGSKFGAYVVCSWENIFFVLMQRSLFGSSSGHTRILEGKSIHTT